MNTKRILVCHLTFFFYLFDRYAKQCSLQLVGLGNYTHPLTRHSIGMVILDRIAQQLNLTWTLQRGWKGTSASGKLLITDKSSKRSRSTDPIMSVTTEIDITLLKPKLLMNVCGPSVAKAGKPMWFQAIAFSQCPQISKVIRVRIISVSELKIPLSNVYVIHDDLQRQLGKVSLKEGGSANGHNGIKSVAKHLRSDDFKRLRIGIGRPPKDVDDRSFDIVADYVLGKLTDAEFKALEEHVYPLLTSDGLNHLCLKDQLLKLPKPGKPQKVRQLRANSLDAASEVSESSSH
jgi:PTH1 family peptidyl-tRNA hydrolase